jgi:dCMP deaminase
MKRPNIHEYLMNIAVSASLRATCPALHVGCVIATQDGHVLSIGYNGVAHGEKHCRTKEGQCLENGPFHRVVHAEQNAVAHAAKRGIRLENSIAYITAEPCGKCKTLLKQSGVEWIVTPSNPRKPIPVLKTSEAQRRAAAKWNKVHPKHFKRLSKAKYLRGIKSGYHNDRARFNKYGITASQFRLLIKKQHGQCAICGNKFLTTPHIDHCHQSFKIRGLLCSKCNFILGLAKDNPKILEAGRKYLIQYETI